MKKLSLYGSLFLYLGATLALYIVMADLLIKVSPEHAVIIGSLAIVRWLTAKITNLHIKDINNTLQNLKEKR